jgi:uncharacterized SAM-binding protein YcdF (DUF218 family)
MAYVSWFEVTHTVAFGTGVWVVGSCSCLGSWSVSHAQPLRWHPNHVWSARIRHQPHCIFDHQSFEYKYIEWQSPPSSSSASISSTVVGNHQDPSCSTSPSCATSSLSAFHHEDSPQWEPRVNRRVDLPPEHEATDGTHVVRVTDRWDSDFTIREFTVFPPSVKSAVVVLGKRLLPTGKPSSTLEARMHTALQVFEQEHADYLVVTGGRVENGAAPLLDDAGNSSAFPSEAEVMRSIALAADGINDSVVLKDDLASNTIENALNVRDLAEDHGLGTLIIVTSDYHEPRARAIFESVFRSRPNIALQYHSHVSPISELERSKEEQVERFMMEKLDFHLHHYINNNT